MFLLDLLEILLDDATSAVAFVEGIPESGSIFFNLKRVTVEQFCHFELFYHVCSY